jgi:hypothetical protein|tara:strand:+ start:387 stop:551 length:165 start_codon:yes stop_codon:yes gene_type:complete
MSDLSVDKLLSRLYSIQRGVVSPKNALTKTMSRIYSKNRGVTNKYGGKINKNKK